MPRRETAYDYCDAAGNLLYQSVRVEPGQGGRKKDFYQRKPDGKGGFIHGAVEPAQRVVYRLPQLKGKSSAIVCEGEKDVDACWKAGLPATCNVGGTAMGRREDYGAQLKAAPEYQTKAGAPRGPVLVRLADVKAEQISWLWKRRIARGKMTLLMGDPGAGKSYITADVASRISLAPSRSPSRVREPV